MVDSSKRNVFQEWLERWTDQHADLTQQEQANILGIRRSSLSTYLNGRALPSRKNIRSIARATGVDERAVRDMVEESVTPNRQPDEPEEEAENSPTVIAARQDKDLDAESVERIERIVTESYRRRSSR